MSLLTEMIKSSEGRRIPMLLEMPISSSLDGPFLVSSSKGFIWVEEKFPSGIVRAAVRKVPWGFLFREALETVARESVTRSWGSFHPPTTEGVTAAVGHLRDYELEPIDVLYGDGFDRKLLPIGLNSVERTTWIPEGWAVFVPQNRSYVGTTVDFGGGQMALLLHNASRGIAIVAPGVPEKDG